MCLRRGLRPKEQTDARDTRSGLLLPALQRTAGRTSARRDSFSSKNKIQIFYHSAISHIIREYHSLLIRKGDTFLFFLERSRLGRRKGLLVLRYYWLPVCLFMLCAWHLSGKLRATMRRHSLAHTGSQYRCGQGYFAP